MSYNGWTNRETWLVSVWFNPESREAVYDAQEIIDSEFEKLPPFMQDLCNISAIDWTQLLSSMED